LPSVQLITPDDGHRRCPKHVEFRDEINFRYLMHLVGCLYGDDHHALSLEQKMVYFYLNFILDLIVILDIPVHNKSVRFMHPAVFNKPYWTT
jgi:hypothetical protein